MYSQFTKDGVKKFVGMYGNDIIAAITDQELFFPAVIGQLTMESTWGESGLSSKYNNYAGIKSTGSSFSNGSVSLDTTEVVKGKEKPMAGSFATYPDFKNFLADYVRVLHLPHFVAAGVFTATSPYNQVLAMGKGGYSSRDPEDYLKRAKGRIDACIDLFPWGKISGAAPVPGQLPGALFIGIGTIMQNVGAVIGGTIGGSVKPAT